ncbi:MAG: hypothetical protein Kow00124_20520 [Anaerolineae bacterium]
MSDEWIEGRSLRGQPRTAARQAGRYIPLPRQAPPPEKLPRFRTATGELQPITPEVIDAIEAMVEAARGGQPPADLPADFVPAYRSAAGEIAPLTPEKLAALRALLRVHQQARPAPQAEPLAPAVPRFDEETGQYEPLLIEEPDAPLLGGLGEEEDDLPAPPQPPPPPRPDVDDDSTGEYARLPAEGEVIDAEWVIEVGQQLVEGEGVPPEAIKPARPTPPPTPRPEARPAAPAPAPEPRGFKTTYFMQRLTARRLTPLQFLAIFGAILVLGLVIFVPLALTRNGGGDDTPPPVDTGGPAAGELPAEAAAPTAWPTATPPAPTLLPYAQGRIAFASDRDGNFEIYVLDMVTRVSARLTTNDADDREPAWSPDGLRLAFVSTRDGEAALYVMNSDGSGVIRVTAGGEGVRDHSPAWSPDGQRIAFTRETAGGSGLYLLDTGCLDQPEACEETVTPITTDTFDRTPDWSPDGRLIAYTAAEFAGLPSAIALIDPAGESRRALAGTGSSDSAPRWSPDGRRLAFVSNREGDPDLWLMDAAGADTAPIQITLSSANDVEPDWSPDGVFLVFASDRGEQADFELYLVRADCVDVEDCEAGLLQITSNQAQDINPAWTP